MHDAPEFAIALTSRHKRTRAAQLRRALTPQRWDESLKSEILPEARISYQDELQHGDLLFARRPGGIQVLIDIAGDRFRHVGILERHGGRSTVLEVGRPGYRTRELGEFVDAYETIAVARLSTNDCRCSSLIVEDARRLMKGPPCTYVSRKLLAFAGLVSLVRGQSLCEFSYPVACWVMRCIQPDTMVLQHSCATFIVRAFEEICPHHTLDIDLSVAKTVQDRHQHQFGELASLVALPDDIWRSSALAQRFWLKTAATDDQRRAVAARPVGSAPAQTEIAA